eukprot:augustus_masked-scaffold_26-processed-gene-4.12-mRNA-1 protein AED:1.00 eAED:1.00 QI:0/0/0/0/1/1/5/0/494
MTEFLILINEADLMKIAFREFGMKSPNDFTWLNLPHKQTEFLQIDLGLQMHLRSPTFNKSTVAFKTFNYNQNPRAWKIQTFQMFNLLQTHLVSATVGEKSKWIPMNHDRRRNAVKVLKAYGGHYHQLNGLYSMRQKKNRPTGLGLTNHRAKEMARVEVYIKKFLEEKDTGLLDVWLNLGRKKFVEKRKEVEGSGRKWKKPCLWKQRKPRSSPRGLGGRLKRSSCLTNDDITRFLQAKFPNDYGWNRSMQRIVLVAINYEIIWESLDVAHDLSWLETTADALDYLKDTVLSTEKPVKAVGKKAGGDWNYEVKAFQEQQDSHNCGVFALIHCLQFMNVTFSGGIRRVAAKPVKEMREHLFEWENHPRFRADDETVLQIQSVTAKVHNFVENDVVREEEDESEDTETNEDDEANPTEDGQHNEEDDEENVQMSEDGGGKFLGQQMIDQRFDDVGASGMDMIAMGTEGQPPTPLSDVTTVLERQNDLHLSDITTVPET